MFSSAARPSRQITVTVRTHILTAILIQKASWKFNNTVQVFYEESIECDMKIHRPWETSYISEKSWTASLWARSVVTCTSRIPYGITWAHSSSLNRRNGQRYSGYYVLLSITCCYHWHSALVIFIHKSNGDLDITDWIIIQFYSSLESNHLFALSIWDVPRFTTP